MESLKTRPGSTHENAPQDLAISLEQPHPLSLTLAEEGFHEWTAGLPQDDVADLVDLDSGTPIRWIPGEGWRESAD